MSEPEGASVPLKIPPPAKATAVCRFCLTQATDMYRLPWAEWPGSDVGRMYQNITGHEVLAMEGLTELYCVACVVRLRKTNQTLLMFNEAARFWDQFAKNLQVEVTNGNESMYEDMLDDEEPTQMEELDVKTTCKICSFECYVCRQQFSVKETLMIHLAKHPTTLAKLYPCKLCSRSFTTNASMLLHMDRVHTHCPEPNCNKTFANKRLADDHWRKQHDPNREQFVCNICDKTFNQKSNLHVHMKGHNRTMYDILGCAHCDKTFFSKTILKNHLHRVHVRDEVQCPQCNKTFRNRAAMRTHQRRHNEWKHECEVCHKRFHRRFDLGEHFRIQHTNEHPYVCATCGAMFRSKQSLDVHNMQPCRVLPKMCMKPSMRRLNNRLKPMLQCRSCEKKYTVAQTLKYHYRDHHPLDDFDAVARLICFQCCIQFDNATAMSAHVATHIKLECVVCKNLFLNEQSLKNHMQSHSTKERPFTCELCHATFVRQVHLNGHMRRRHTLERPFECDHDLCGKKFVDKCELRAHYRKVHDKLKPHKCTICEKSYSTVMMLGIHMIRHTGTGHKYLCTICDEKFVNATFLNTHVSRRHGASETNV